MLLALLVSLAGTGVGYACWGDTVTIRGELRTGQLGWGLGQYCCCCVCCPCDCEGEGDGHGGCQDDGDGHGACSGDGDSPGSYPVDLNQSEEELARSLGYRSLDDLSNKLRRNRPPTLGCGCHNDCDIEGIDADGDGDADKLVVTCNGRYCAGILRFAVINTGTIPLKITGVNQSGFTRLRVWPIRDPVGEQLEPGECTEASYLWAGVLDDQSGSYQFEVTVDADYWHLP